jgi:hypothetical protein
LNALFALNARRRVALGLAGLLAGLAGCSATGPSSVPTPPSQGPKMTTSTYIYFVFANPAEGQEARFNEWYDQQHLRDVVAVPGFKSAQRYVLNELPLYKEMDVKLPKYLAAYTIETDDLEGVFKEVSRRLKSGETKLDPAFDGKSYVGYTYQTLGPFVQGAGGEAPDALPGAKQKYVHIVFTPFNEGREAQFNDIYDRFHAPELAANRGFAGAQRMLIARQEPERIASTKYSALFYVETSDLAAVKKVAVMGGTPNPGQDYKATRGYTYREIGPLLKGDQVRAERAK